MNLEHLEHYLAKERHNFENVFIATESIFSMDGMRTDLRKLVELKHKYNAFLYLDEAHAFGVCGTKGLGCADELNLIDEIDIIVGTFGKALASIGAFAVCDDIIRKFLVNKSRSLIYTTGLPPLNLAWTSFILNKLTDFEPQRKIVNQTWKCFSDKLNIKAESHIIPYILGNNEDVIDFAGYMQKNGFYVLPIRHPTVPIGTARIRFSINAAVTPEQLEPIFDLFYKFSPKNK